MAGPMIALGAFCGLRSAEILRLDWSEVRLDRGFVEVPALKSKTAARRIVPIPDNLKEWLAPWAEKKQGKVWPFSRAYFHEAEREASARTGDKKKKVKPVPWRKNGLRHSWISYRVAEIKNVSQVALEAGNSPQMVFRNYRELTTEADAKTWFAVTPTPAKNIVPMAKAV